MVLSAGIIVVRSTAAGWKYLVLRAFRNWDFPKGEVEPGESPLITALRETREETGITELHFRWGEGYAETTPYNRGTKVARYYLAETRLEHVAFSINPEIGGPEHHEYRWLGFAELQAICPPRLQRVVRWARSLVET